MRITTGRALGYLTTAGALAIIGVAGAGPAGAASAHASALTPSASTGNPVPAAFQPVSASFVAASWGVVLGGLGCHGQQACPARLAVTSDGGSRWQFMNTPSVWLNVHTPQVNEVVFATRQTGYLYDQYGSKKIWVTHNAGATWRTVTLNAPVSAVASAGGWSYAVAGNSLWQTRTSQDMWTRIPHVKGSILGVGGHTAWFGSNTSIATSSNGWRRSFKFSCPKPHTVWGLAGISAANSSDVAFFCANFQGMFHTNKLVLTSTNGGKTTSVAGKQAPMEGDPNGFAVPPGNPSEFVIAVVTPGQSYLARSVNGGHTWTQFNAPGTSGGTNLSSLAFASTKVGDVVVGGLGQIGSDRLLRTTNGGRTWKYVRL